MTNDTTHPTQKRCKKCGELYHAYCRNCKREYYIRNKERILERHHEHYRKNRDKILEQKREYQRKNRSLISQKRRASYYQNHEYHIAQKHQHRLANRENANFRKRENYRANPQKFIFRSREYRSRYPDRVSIQNRKRRQSNPDLYSTLSHRRRARLQSLPSNWTALDWQRALDYFGGCCAACGKSADKQRTIAADHWIPLSHPDCPGTVPENIIPLCHSRKNGTGGCNNSKQKRLPETWLIEHFGEDKAAAILQRIQTYFAIIRQ